MTDYSKIPGTSPFMEGAVIRYLEKGIPPGSFLTAVICNDLAQAVREGDTENQALLADWVKFFYNEAPGCAWGSREAMDAWVDAAREHVA